MTRRRGLWTLLVAILFAMPLLAALVVGATVTVDGADLGAAEAMELVDGDELGEREATDELVAGHVPAMGLAGHASPLRGHAAPTVAPLVQNAAPLAPDPALRDRPPRA